MLWLLKLVPRQAYGLVALALGLQLAGIDVLGMLGNLVIDPAVTALEDWLTSINWF